MTIKSFPKFRFRRLLLFSQEAAGCGYKKGGKKKSGFDEMGLMVFLFGKSFRIDIPGTFEEILEYGETINKKDAMTGDLVIYEQEDQEGKPIIALVLGRIERQIIYSSQQEKRVVIKEFTDQIDKYSLTTCLRIVNRAGKIH